jgi:glutamate N-acetyltransferase/amino-acid N-acetyltransferase
MKLITCLLIPCCSGFMSSSFRSSSSSNKQLELGVFSFHTSETYVQHLSTLSQLPGGFRTGLTRFTFEPAEVAGKTLPMNITLIVADAPTPIFAAMFTSNKFPGGPVVVGKNRLKYSKSLQAVIINNKISNVSPSGVTDLGAGDSERLCEAVAKHLQLPSKDLVFPSSTGIIGWRLPIKAMEQALPAALGSLQSSSMLPAALGIMTTDRYPKLRRYNSVKGTWSIVGIAKGAGMIEPNMATMLSYIVTDLDMSRSFLQSSLEKAVSRSFNTISVDGDQSTSDTGNRSFLPVSLTCTLS